MSQDSHSTTDHRLWQAVHILRQLTVWSWQWAPLTALLTAWTLAGEVLLQNLLPSKAVPAFDFLVFVLSLPALVLQGIVIRWTWRFMAPSRGLWRAPYIVSGLLVPLFVVYGRLMGIT
jgi:hypothetical protein